MAKLTYQGNGYMLDDETANTIVEYGLHVEGTHTLKLVNNTTVHIATGPGIPIMLMMDD